MTSWEIDPAGVKSVLDAMDPDLETLSGLLDGETFTEIQEKVTTGSPVTAKVEVALQVLLADQGDEMTTIVNHVGAGMQGVVNATIAYATAQEGMREQTAAKFQEEMFKAARSGDFGYFTKHGYKDD